MSHGERDAYRALPAGARRAVRRAARRGRRAQFPGDLAGPILGFARRRQRGARRLLVVAVLVILASAAGAALVSLRYGPGLLLALPVAGLLVGGVLGVRSESRLRRAEEAEALAEQQVRRRGTPAAAAPVPEPPRRADAAQGPGRAHDGDPARARLARILAGEPPTGPDRTGPGSAGPGDAGAGRHPWD